MKKMHKHKTVLLGIGWVFFCIVGNKKIIEILANQFINIARKRKTFDTLAGVYLL